MSAWKPSNSSFYQMIRNDLPVVFFAIDTNGIFQFSEGKGLMVLGLQENEANGESVFTLFKNNSSLLLQIKDALQTHKGFSAIDEVNGRVFRCSFQPEHQAGQFVGLIGVAIEITELSEQTHTLLRYEKKMNDIVVHDMRGLMAGIISFLSCILKGEVIENLTAHQTRIFRMMKDNADGVLMMIGQLLERDSENLRVEQIATSEFFLNIFDKFRPIVREQNKQLILRTDKAPAFCHFDRMLMQRLISNLILNGLEHAKESRFIEIEVFEKQNKSLIIQVKNQGQAFSPPDAQATPPQDGRGFGLKSVEKILELHGGGFQVLTLDAHCIIEISIPDLSGWKNRA